MINMEDDYLKCTSKAFMTFMPSKYKSDRLNVNFCKYIYGELSEMYQLNDRINMITADIETLEKTSKQI